MTTQHAERIGGWLLAPLAWLLVSISGQTLSLAYTIRLQFPQVIAAVGNVPAVNLVIWSLSFAFASGIWFYTLWLVIAFFKRRRSVPKQMIIWLLITLLLALKSFAFLPVSDEIAVRDLLFALAATALIVPYLKRAERVKNTFVNP
ncbi:DUF2569 domain-containing protein [Yokenella regensburgei]|uniref:DUF2569 family protein n=1 Tax=Yokenella regensburgei TaxID=158877 RepID=UPI003F13FF6A